MDDNLDSQSMDQKSNHQAKPDHKRIDSIPLWLQGISENAASSREPNEGEWQKEQSFVASQETGPTTIEITELDSSEDLEPEFEPLDAMPSEEKEAPLPQWIEETEAPIDEEQTINITVQQSDLSENEPDEITEEVLIDHPTQSEAIEQPLEPEISEIDEEPVEIAPADEHLELEAVEHLELEMVEEISSSEEDNPAPWDQMPDNFQPIIVEEVHSEKEDNLAPWDQMPDNFQAIEIEPEIEEPAPDELLAESEEIPEWLREMIAADEKQEKEGAASHTAWRSEEPTQPVVVTPMTTAEDEQPASPIEEAPFNPKPGIDEVEESPKQEEFSRPAVMPRASFSRLFEEPVQEAPPQNEPEEPETPSLEEFDLKLERDFSADYEDSGFKPIQFDPPVIDEQQIEEENKESQNDTPREEEPEQPVEFVLEDWSIPSEPEESEPEELISEPQSQFEPAPTSFEMELTPEFEGEIPSSLIQAKQILEQGGVREALEIIRSYISQSQYLDEIKDWLLTANENFEKNKSGLWEALGDISSHQGDYSRALSAYAKAIEFLELSRKSHNEIG